jgi:hypothetical protein
MFKSALLIFCVTALVGCKQKNSFESCVEYWTKDVERRTASRAIIKAELDYLISFEVKNNCKLTN